MQGSSAQKMSLSQTSSQRHPHSREPPGEGGCASAPHSLSPAPSCFAAAPVCQAVCDPWHGAGSPAGFSRTWLLSPIGPAVWFAAQLCTTGSAQWGGGGQEEAAGSVARWETRQPSSAEGNCSWERQHGLQVLALEPLSVPPLPSSPGPAGTHSRGLLGATALRSLGTQPSPTAGS